MPAPNPYREFVSGFAQLLTAGADVLPPGQPPPRTAVTADAPKVLLLSPHPDDECLTGALPLRLRRERGMNVINVAVTLGSKTERREERWGELTAACAWLGFGLIAAAANGLTRIHPGTRAADPDAWQSAVAAIATTIRTERPAILFLPHRLDRHPTHIGTHILVLDALATLGDAGPMWIVETEYWGQLVAPNLMVGSSVDDVADLVAAVACHRGEVARNRYHLALPAGMIDAARRGAELVNGHGTAAPPCLFATLYKVSHRNRKASITTSSRRWVIPAETDLSDLFAPSRHVGQGEEDR